VSLGPAGGNGALDAYFDRASADGSRVFFETNESLVGSDTDAYRDVYQRYGGTTTLVSPGATSYTNLVGLNDNGTRVFLLTGDQLAASDTDTQGDIYVSLDTGVYARPKGASPLLVPLVIAYQDCTSANTVHGAPLSYPSCKPPLQTSDWLTVGTPDANGVGVKSVGEVLVKAVVGDTSTVADEADAKFTLSVTDVRNKSGLGDYAGELDVRLDPTIGSTCSANTTADAIVPGVVSEGKRTIWEVGTVQVFDGGSDGQAGTAPNTLFERQGVFVP
jgi:hypothetical protein